MYELLHIKIIFLKDILSSPQYLRIDVFKRRLEESASFISLFRIINSILYSIKSYPLRPEFATQKAWEPDARTGKRTQPGQPASNPIFFLTQWIIQFYSVLFTFSISFLKRIIPANSMQNLSSEILLLRDSIPGCIQWILLHTCRIFAISTLT